MKRTTKMMAGVLATASIILAACGDDLPAKPTAKDCKDWEWDRELGTYYCDDDGGSGRGGSYYYNGKYYGSKSALKDDASYKTYAGQYKSGIGSGAKGGVGG